MLNVNLFFVVGISIAQLSADTQITSIINNLNPKMVFSPPSKQDSGLRWSSETALTTSQASDFMAREQRSCKKFEHFIGSNLFDGDRKICFSPEDVNVLAARREFELVMMPRDMTLTILDDKSVCIIMRYFCYGHLLIRRLKDCSTSRVIKKAFFDAFGGFMHHYLLPVVKISFYIGDVQLKTVRKVINYYQKCRFFLNTNGNGWRTPLHFPLESLKNLTLKSMPRTENPACVIESPNGDYCMGLDFLLHKLDSDKDENMIVALPKLDFESNDGLLGNIWLPFSRKTTFSLRSCKSAFLLVGYHKKVSRCYWQRHIPQVSFDKKFRKWIAENILPHLNDEEFYPSLGGVISLYKYLEKSDEYNTVNERNAQEDTNFIISKRHSSRVQRRKTSKYNELANKIKNADECEMNWLQEINKFSDGKKATEKNKKEKKTNKKKKRTKKKKTIKDFEQQEEEVGERASKDKIKNKDGKMKKKSLFKLNWRKWFGLSGNSSSKKNKKSRDAKRKKKSFFNWSWPKWFDSPELNWSLKWGWLKLLKKLLKYGILLLVTIIIFCLLFKLTSLIAGILCGVGGSIGGDCFGIMINSIFGFLKNVFQVLAVLFTCSFAALCNWCGKAANASQPYRRDFEKPALPEIRIPSEPELTTPIISKRKKSRYFFRKSDRSEVSEDKKSKKSTPKNETEKNEDIEGKSTRKSRSWTRKRFRGGQSKLEMLETDSSTSSEEKESWQTLYEI